MSYKITGDGFAVTASETINNEGPLVFLEIEFENTVVELNLTFGEAKTLAYALHRVSGVETLEDRITRLEQVLEVAE